MPHTPIGCRLGLHEIQDAVNQLSYMEQHSTHLLNHINVMLEQTYAMSPKRKASYKLDRGEGKRPTESQRERLLEKAIWRKWRRAAGLAGDHSQECLLTEQCTHIQTYQMPLQDRRSDKSWGKIDLVGVSPTGMPVVLELKKDDAGDTPLRILVEGLAYAVAVRRAWNEGTLREQWLQQMIPTPFANEIPTALLTVPVIGIAPSSFWNQRLGNGGPNRIVKSSAWTPFRKLCEACNDRGFPISFLEFDTLGNDTNGFPLIENVRSVHLPQ